MITGLGALSLLVVLVVAIWRGQRAALVAALISVIALNFFFVEPKYHLAVAELDNAVALIVLFVVALIVGRLAGRARRDADRASERAREAELIARAGTALLDPGDVDAQLAAIGARLEESSGGELRLGLTGAPEAGPDERAVRLPASSAPAWLYAKAGTGWDAEGADRIAEPLARLIDVARERQRTREQSAEAEATRQRGRRQDRSAPRDLPRSALAADRDHDRGRRSARGRGSAPKTGRRSRR